MLTGAREERRAKQSARDRQDAVDTAIRKTTSFLAAMNSACDHAGDVGSFEAGIDEQVNAESTGAF